MGIANALVYNYLKYELDFSDLKIIKIKEVDNVVCVTFNSEKEEKYLTISLLELMGFMYNCSQKTHFTKRQIAGMGPSGSSENL